jgi:hypothetical protein
MGRLSIMMSQKEEKNLFGSRSAPFEDGTGSQDAKVAPSLANDDKEEKYSNETVESCSTHPDDSDGEVNFIPGGALAASDPIAVPNVADKVAEPIAVPVSPEDIEREVQARILASAVLARSVEETPHDHDLEDNSSALKSGTEKTLHSGRSWNWIVVTWMVILVLVGSSIGIVLSRKNSEMAALSTPTSAPTSSATEPQAPNHNKLLDFLISLSYDKGAALKDLSSSQYLAFSYILESNIYGTPKWLDRDVLQIYSLATLYFNTNGPGWTNNDGWLASPDVAHPCTWHGVQCAADVVHPCTWRGLECDYSTNHTSSGNRRLGTYESKRQQQVRRLVADAAADSSNTAPIVSGIGDIGGLISMLERVNSLPQSFTIVGLHLPYNGLDGFGLVELTYLVTLQAIDVSGNNFNNQPLPLDIMFLSILEHVNVSNARFGEPLATLGFLAPKWNKLQTIDISRNNISGTLPPDFGVMLSLKVLVADQNPRLTGSVPDNLCQLANLTRVTVDCDLVLCSCCTPHCVANGTRF